MTTKTCQCGKPPKRNAINLLAVLPAEYSGYWQRKGYVKPDKDGAILRIFPFGKDGKNGIYIVPSGSPAWTDRDAFLEALHMATVAFKEAAKVGANCPQKRKSK